MQDRFKFRIFINNEIQEVFYFYKSENGVIFACTDLEDDTGFNIDGSTLMQCTGLKDKNGKLIYEGDIVKINDYGKPIEVRFYCLGFELYRSPDNLVGYHNDKYFPESIEVIGNIYQDSHLLENNY